MSRGIAMLLVVMGHIIFFSLNREENCEYSYLFKLICHFHIPLFFVISGLLVKYKGFCLNDIRIKFIKKFTKLLVPFLFFGFIYSFLCNGNPIGLILASMHNGYWFFIVLLECYCLLYLISLVRLLYKHIIVDIVCVILLCILPYVLESVLPDVIVNTFSLEQLRMYLPFFLTSALLSNNVDMHKYMHSNLLYTIVIICSLITVPFWINGYPHLGLVSKLALILLVLFTSAQFCKSQNIFCRILEKIGKETMQIYCIHYFLIYLLSLPFVGMFLRDHYSLLLEFVIVLILSLLIVALTHCMGKVLHKSNFIKVYIYGE